MNTKLVYLYDPTSLQYAGTMNAQENPVRPGEFLLPLHYTDTWPGNPVNGTTQLYNAKGDSWDSVTIPVQQVPDLSGELAQQQAVAALQDIAMSQLTNIINYIANQPDAPREIKDARQQITQQQAVVGDLSV